MDPITANAIHVVERDLQDVAEEALATRLMLCALVRRLVANQVITTNELADVVADAQPKAREAKTPEDVMFADRMRNRLAIIAEGLGFADPAARRPQ